MPAAIEKVGPGGTEAVGEGGELRESFYRSAGGARPDFDHHRSPQLAPTVGEPSDDVGPMAFERREGNFCPNHEARRAQLAGGLVHQRGFSLWCFHRWTFVESVSRWSAAGVPTPLGRAMIAQVFEMPRPRIGARWPRRREGSTRLLPRSQESL